MRRFFNFFQEMMTGEFIIFILCTKTALLSKFSFYKLAISQDLKKILWNGNNCSYYVLILLHAYFLYVLCALHHRVLNSVFTVYISSIILAFLILILNFKCSFHDKLSSNRMHRNFINDCLFIT